MLWSGYANSGKSTLLNTLCQNKEKRYLRRICYLRHYRLLLENIKIKNHKCLFTDTVGFIERLPHSLIQAFRSTLEEVKEADLLLHVVDSSFEDYQLQVDTTNKVLEELGVENTPMIYVYNKVDLNKYGYVHPVTPYVFISAKEKIGLDLLEDGNKSYPL
ncbi:GTPase [Catenibacterium sp.]|uniref:GTPase n=1 Tax=Catenibacterium sp. TaxID=2049022 RepID=UPI0039969A90